MNISIQDVSSPYIKFLHTTCTSTHITHKYEVLPMFLAEGVEVCKSENAHFLTTELMKLENSHFII